MSSSGSLINLNVNSNVVTALHVIGLVRTLYLFKSELVVSFKTSTEVAMTAFIRQSLLYSFNASGTQTGKVPSR